MKRVLGTILFVFYAIIAITVTVLLLSFNDYNCSELGDYTIYIANDDSLEPDFKRGSILIIKGASDRNIKVGDKLLLYNVINSNEFEVVNETLQSKVQQGRHIAYTVGEAGETYYNDYVIGKTEDVKVIEGWGTLLSILESKWGYLFCIVVVSLLLFLQEVFDLIMEIKYGGGTTSTKKSSASSQTAKKRTTTSAGTKTTAKSANATKTGTKTTTKSATKSATTAKATVAKAVKEEPVEELVEEPEVNNSEDTEVEEG